jgi:hypothetical protein
MSLKSPLIHRHLAGGVERQAWLTDMEPNCHDGNYKHDKH